MFNGQVDLFQSLMLPHVAPSVPNFAHFASSDFCFGGHAKVTKNRRLNLILDGVSVKNQGSDSNSLRQNHPWFFLMEQGYDFLERHPSESEKGAKAKESTFENIREYTFLLYRRCFFSQGRLHNDVVSRIQRLDRLQRLYTYYIHCMTVHYMHCIHDTCHIHLHYTKLH